MGTENPAYRIEDLTINNEEELKEAKKAAGVKSHKDAVDAAAKYAWETNDDKLLDNAQIMGADLDSLEKIGKEDNLKEKLGERAEEIIDAVAEIANGNEETYIRYAGRANFHCNIRPDADYIIEMIKKEADDERRGILPDDTKKKFV